MSQGAGFEHTSGNGTPSRAGPWPAASVALLSAGILATDLYAPAGAAVGLAYGLPIFLVSRVAPSLIFPAAAIATLLAAGGYLYELQPSARSPALANLALVLCGLWGWSWILKNWRDALDALRHENPPPRGEKAAQRSRGRTPEARAPSADIAVMTRQAAIVAHELRNPIGVIATSVGFISAKADFSNPELLAAIARAKRAINRCEKIISEHLELARSDQRFRPVAIDRWLSKVFEELTLPEAVALHCELDAEDALVALDEESMRRALINLVDNACQAMLGDGRHDRGRAPPSIVVSSGSDGAGVEITVTDNGPGIPPAILQRLPEPMLSTKPSGTGLGLITVKRILEEHSGSLTIASQPGEGARMTLRLPRQNR